MTEQVSRYALLSGFLVRLSHKLFGALSVSVFTTMRALTPAGRSLQPAGLPACYVLPSCHSISKHPMQPGHRFNSQVSVIREFQASP